MDAAGNMHAVKCICKDTVVRHQAQKQTETEIRLLTGVVKLYVVTLSCCQMLCCQILFSAIGLFSIVLFSNCRFLVLSCLELSDRMQRIASRRLFAVQQFVVQPDALAALLPMPSLTSFGTSMYTPFIVRLHCTMQDERCVFLVMEMVSGFILLTIWHIDRIVFVY